MNAKDPEMRHVRFMQSKLIIEPRHVGVAPLGERPPVVGRDRAVEAVARRVLREMGQAGRVPHDFLRDAADVDAGAAEPPALDDDRFLAVFRRPFGGRQTAAATAYRDEIESSLHSAPPL